MRGCELAEIAFMCSVLIPTKSVRFSDCECSRGLSMTTYEPAYQMPAAVTHSPQQRPREFSHLSARPLSGALGAEITGVELATLSESGFDEVNHRIYDSDTL